MIRKKVKRSWLFNLAILCYILGVILYTVWNYLEIKKDIMRNIDSKLYIGASTIKYIIEKDFHDRAVDNNSISDKEDLSNIIILSACASENGFKYLYTVIRKDGHIYLTSTSASEEEKKEHKEVRYFELYDDTSDELKHAFDTLTLTYTNYTDRWGTFRTVAIPEKSPDGNIYLACAEYDISYVDKLLQKNFFVSILWGGFFLLLAIPLILIYSYHYKEYIRQIEGEIEERIEAEQLLHRATGQLRLKEKQQRALLDNIPDKAWLKDGEGRYMAVNDAMAEGCNLKSGDIINRTDYDIYSSELADKYRKQDKEVLLTGNRYMVEECVKYHGKDIWFEIIISPFYDNKGEISGTAGVSRDITVRKQIELGLIKTKEELETIVTERTVELEKANKLLHEAKEKAEAASVLKGQFLANMGHEIRTPMNGISGAINFLLETSLDEEQTELCEIVKTSAKSLLKLINDILDYSKIEAGKMNLDIIEFELDLIINDIIELVSLTVREKNLKVYYSIDSNIPLQLRGDSGKLGQVLLNLLGNAVKFTEEGEVSLKLNLEEERGNEVLIRFTVSDTGIGMPEKRMDRLFKSFSQIDPSTTREYGGTGLGLAISKSLVEMMGGNIDVISREGKGSKFWFTALFEKC